MNRGDEAKRLDGVVVEVALDQGLDILAAYADHSARYYNYSGSAVIWERPDPSLDAHIDALLAAGAAILAQIGAWEGARCPAPPRGQSRISMLAPVGWCLDRRRPTRLPRIHSRGLLSMPRPG